MKKIFMILIFLLLLVSCGKKEEKSEINYTYDIISKSVDMSAYEGVSSTKHKFRLITPTEFFNCMDNKSSGVFYLGRNNCGCCQRVTRYLDEVSRELDVTVYYIDVYNEEETLMDQDVQDKMYEYMYPILGESEGEKTILTPQLFSVINGEFAGSQICFDDFELDPTPTEKQIEKFKDAYRKILSPFANAD
ncbi:MAG: glutaredoxin family protein [Erysipelotrichaceae bacterium]|nr:glutaredoxin family protein [Erysipelotrichaceae bacterium]